MQSIYANGAADGDYMGGHWRITELVLLWSAIYVVLVSSISSVLVLHKCTDAHVYLSVTTDPAIIPGPAHIPDAAE